MTKWLGWVLFAGLVLVAAGVLNVIQGFVALFDEDYYLVGPSGLVVEVSYTTWGWVLMAFGVLMAATGSGVMVGRTWARVVGVILTAVNTFVNLAFVAAYPFWTVLAVALDVIVIYALTVHGREAKNL